ncbi:MAG: glycosyltransferase family 4 protein [Hyphomicrobiaceae bacterium]
MSLEIRDKSASPRVACQKQHECGARDYDVVHMTSVHPAFDSRIFHKMAVSLAQSGRRVGLVVPHDRDEQVNGVSVLAVGKSNGRLGRFFVTSWRVAQRAWKTRAPICHFHDPELMPAAIGLRILGRKVVFDLHEDLPQQIVTKTWIPSVLRYPIGRVSALAEWVTARIVNRVVAATPVIAARFPKDKTVVVQNFPILGELEYERADAAAVPKSRVVCYVGGVGRVRGCVEMVRTLECVDAELLLAGPFETQKTRAQLNGMKAWGKVDYRGIVDRTGVRDILNSSRAGLVVLHPEPNYIASQPIKLFEYMSAGLPVIASDFPLWRKIVDGAGAGLLVDPLNPEEIAAAIEWVFDNEEEAQAMGARGKKAVRDIYNWGHEEAKLLTMYDELSR